MSMPLTLIGQNSDQLKEHDDLVQRLLPSGMYPYNAYCEWDPPSRNCVKNAINETRKILEEFKKLQIPYKAPEFVFSDDRDIICVIWYSVKKDSKNHVELCIRPNRCWLWIFSEESDNLAININSPYYYNIVVFFHAWNAFVNEGSSNFEKHENFLRFQMYSKIIEDSEYEKIMEEYPSSIKDIGKNS